MRSLSEMRHRLDSAQYCFSGQVKAYLLTLPWIMEVREYDGDAMAVRLRRPFGQLSSEQVSKLNYVEVHMRWTYEWGKNTPAPPPETLWIPFRKIYQHTFAHRWHDGNLPVE